MPSLCFVSFVCHEGWCTDSLALRYVALLAEQVMKPQVLYQVQAVLLVVTAVLQQHGSNEHLRTSQSTWRKISTCSVRDRPFPVMHRTIEASQLCRSVIRAPENHMAKPLSNTHQWSLMLMIRVRLLPRVIPLLLAMKARHHNQTAARPGKHRRSGMQGNGTSE